MPHDHKRFDPQNVHRLDDPERNRYLPVDAILDTIGLTASGNVADVGAGNGYFALPIALRIGPAYKLFAVDISQEMLGHLREKLSAPDAPANVVPLLGTDVATNLPDATCALVFMASVWHEFDDHSAVLAEAARILQSGGRIAILDWRPEGMRPPGPPQDHRIPRSTVERTLTDSHWHVQKAEDINDSIYLVVAARP